MRLSNSSFSYFGLFLAREMMRLGHLEMLYTNLPWTRLRDLPPEKYRSQPALSAPMALRKIGLLRAGEMLDVPVLRLYERWVASKLSACDVFHSFSGFALQPMRAARERYGALTIVERGSSHLRFQNDILIDEYRRWGARFSATHPRELEHDEQEYAEADRITVQSTFAEKTFIQLGVPADKILKMPLGVDLKMFRPAPKLDDTFRVLYAGVCSLRKGMPYLLQAMEPVRLPNFEFVINGTITPEVTDVLARYRGPYRYAGFQPLGKLHEVYSQASVLVLPTIEDGFAKVVTEAMACGVPVIATDHCGAPDVVTDGVEGYIVPVRDPAAIREKILYLYENPERREEMGQAALRRARCLINWDCYGENAAATYRRVLDEHHRCRASA
jgi:glycosyltransferase involved in cell wall biosynthesis